ncbi:MAG: TusE/DsrC/DsvC family sulfur relay protein [Gammaproteobacteria bacterium]|nr:TusE/DsrC/DsvC family sulfur relay protein [Gammaproteobacteria bacterium]MDE0282582.1 TusE/DsrC/DsvC family sulfur relay protein [Gammaproteobacteria bacterium]MDE0713571.1 TusE/DsrC/DsvC family sulfur relay protein [Gammaproteobacteria bacterium]MXX16941.1 TusE/DsrC/DsvC family sulfur relay protein [Gammaproteobacteria bacterium]MXY64769.1 TusE/DsrC/DsvC family sulfur relay protein [Gammaproteobacteria bacterium]
MSIIVNNREIETTEEGFLVNTDDWSEDVARQFATDEGLELTDRHWDVIHYLRDEYFNNGGNQPNNRVMAKAMAEKWPGEKVNAGTLFELFPGTPSKQAGRMAGLPESKRKGGY